MFFSQKNREQGVKVETLKFLPLVFRLGEYLKIALDHYVRLQQMGKSLDPDTLALFVEMQMIKWNPKLNDKELLDNLTRKSAARFIAGIVCNFAKDKK